MPLSYFQGLTHSAAGSWFFDGITVGLFRTDRGLVQKADNPSALTPDLTAQGFNHIGDPAHDEAEGGRLTTSSGRVSSCSARPAGRLSAMNGQAPWLRGSSWTQTTSAFG